jgi:hypothetical protein
MATHLHMRSLRFIGTVAAAVVAHAAFAQLVIVAEDPAYGVPPERKDSGMTMWGPAFDVAGGIISDAYGRQVNEVTARFRAAIGVDVLDLARQNLAVPAAAAANPTVIAIADLSDDAVLAAMAERGVSDAFVARYFVVTNRLFWARLIVARVTPGGEKPRFAHVATLYYEAGLPLELQGSRKEGWGSAALDRARAELVPAFVELSALWARVAADSAGGADPQAAWASLPDITQPQEGWVFQCRGQKPGCKRQHLVQITSERAWISSITGAALASLDHGSTEFAVAFNLIQMPTW